METNTCSIFILCLTMAAILFPHCVDAKRTIGVAKVSKHTTSSSSVLKRRNKLEFMSTIMSLVTDQATDSSSNMQTYGVSSPFSLPPFDSLSPISLPETPSCVYPPFTPQTPPTTVPAPGGTTTAPPFYYLPPVFPGQSPPSPPGSVTPNPPVITPNPPETVPSPTTYIPSPPYYEPSPPEIVFPSPPSYIPSPSGIIPSPPVFLPPIVYPPPTVPPPPPSTAPSTPLWCVAKPTVPDPIIQEAVNYACAAGADCDSIQPNGKCFLPNTLYAHASYAFNSYFQRSKVAGGTCEFGGTAMLVTVDPSYDGCHFELY
ncbi:hypothetical protein SLEP1_g38416 [Rubroshorea leprosula]|nr:hypothetical protein SLEP1_g38416 [Rubroshorea leprosula]